jgi:hypothetical protein
MVDMAGADSNSEQSQDPTVGTGTSLALSLGEAIQSAVSGMPPGPGDTGHSVIVEEISYSDGGIVGPALHVRVRSQRPPEGI